MLQGPFKLTVTASINPLFTVSQPGWKQAEKKRIWDSRVQFLALQLSPWPLAEEGRPGGEDAKPGFRRSAASSRLCGRFSDDFK